MLTRFRQPLAVVLASFTYASCSDGQSADESRAWHVSDAPAIQIGVADGDPGYQFYRVQDVRRLSDGRIVVANSGTNELRFFEANGRYHGMSGGAGDGPGEFRALASVAVGAGDSLIALDQANRRVSVFDPSGHYVRSWVAESPGRALTPDRVYVLGDGSVLMAYQRGHRPSDPPGLFRGSAPLVRYSPAGKMLNVVAELPGDEWFYSAENRSLSERPFGRKGHLALSHSEIFIGSGEAEVLVFNVAGELSRTVAVESPEAVTDDHIRAFSEERVQAVSDPGRRPALQRQLAEMSYPSVMPAYAGLLVDSEGNIWTREYMFPERPAVRWTVRDQEGRALATVSLPSAFNLLFADSRSMGGVMTDELGVERVLVFEMLREHSTAVPPRGDL